VFVTGGDPVKSGLVPNLSRPGGNTTGASIFSFEMESKRLGLLLEAVPAVKTIGVLLDPDNTNVEVQRRDVEETARRLGLEVLPFNTNTERGITAAFASTAERKAGAMMVTADPFFNNHRALLIAQAAQYRLPAIFEFREFVAEGGMRHDELWDGADGRL
jgi:putative tryptophan/tyrosine transport system substrate-binding protein